jgi:hypothetical protein
MQVFEIDYTVIVIVIEKMRAYSHNTVVPGPQL